jgi:hypothetical protein
MASQVDEAVSLGYRSMTRLYLPREKNPILWSRGGSNEDENSRFCDITTESVGSASDTKQFQTYGNSRNPKTTHQATLPPDTVEAALTLALTEAAKAGRFDVVSQLAKELEARRLASSPNVVTLDTGKRGAK